MNNGLLSRGSRIVTGQGDWLLTTKLTTGKIMNTEEVFFWAIEGLIIVMLLSTVAAQFLESLI
jgi:hypothetical protein